MTLAPALTGALAEHPALAQWVAFPAPGKVAILTGKVEIGQGVLTAMLQLAAEELDVAPARIAIEAGDTDRTPNEGFTAGSQSMQFGGVALRQACAEVRALFLGTAAQRLGCDATELAVADGRIITVSSMSGITPESPTGPAYSAAKAAVIHLTRYAALEAAPLGITAAGLVAFGLYGIAEAAYRRITPPRRLA